MGGYFGAEFLPTMQDLVAAGLSYDEVKRLVRIPSLSSEDYGRAVQGTGGKVPLSRVLIDG